jgi:hypothetical protein
VCAVRTSSTLQQQLRQQQIHLNLLLLLLPLGLCWLAR